MDTNSKKLLFQHYGYQIQTLIQQHEKLELNVQTSNNRLIIDNLSDEEDYKDNYEPIQIIDVLNDQDSHSVKTVNPQQRGIQGFNNFEKQPLSFRSKEENIKKIESSWLLKQILLSIKFHNKKFEPVIKKNFNSQDQSICLRFIEFGKESSQKDITAIMSDQTHKICCIFPKKHLLNYISKGNIKFDNPFTILNFMLIKKSNLKFTNINFIKKHFKFDVDKNLKYCILEIIEFEYLHSVKSAITKKVKGDEPEYTRISSSGNEQEIESEEEFDPYTEFESDDESYFKIENLKLIYNNELYRRLCLNQKNVK
ncbi:EST3 [Candida jiufengensis]|uniref:EST3 n=1 Tax=Candida jiufengensis TaxID=497108 RepID=UPI0022244CD2|nr:EST3 [Candida jiufengensis]KAI5953213.1 EST3 [Candida jiufengensis]